MNGMKSRGPMILSRLTALPTYSLSECPSTGNLFFYFKVIINSEALIASFLIVMSCFRINYYQSIYQDP